MDEIDPEKLTENSCLLCVGDRPSAETVMAMLQALLRSNLALTSETAEVVRTRLEGAVTEPMVELLDKLTSGESFRPLRQRSQTSMQSPGATERNLLLTHIRNRRLDEALTLKAEMEAKSLPLSLPVQVLVHSNLVKMTLKAS